MVKAYLGDEEIGGIPRGIISMWSGALADIPSGWALCNGQNGTPNLFDRFICGVPNATTNPGTAGGANTRSLTVANLPTHNHPQGGSAASAGAHTHSIRTVLNVGGGTVLIQGGAASTEGGFPTQSAGAHTHTLSGNTGNSGSGQAFDVRPAFFTLAYIMKL